MTPVSGSVLKGLRGLLQHVGVGVKDVCLTAVDRQLERGSTALARASTRSGRVLTSSTAAPASASVPGAAAGVGVMVGLKPVSAAAAAAAAVSGKDAASSVPTPQQLEIAKPIASATERDASLPLPLTAKNLIGVTVYDNPWAPGACIKSFRDIFRMVTDSARHMKPIPTKDQVLSELPPADYEVTVQDIHSHLPTDPMLVTWIGHATCLVQVGGLNILTDPLFSDRCSASQHVGPKRFTPPAVRMEDLPRIDLVVVSHSHYDHLDVNSVKALSGAHSPLWLVPLGLKQFMLRQGVAASLCLEMNWWDELHLRLPSHSASSPGGRGRGKAADGKEEKAASAEEGKPAPEGLGVEEGLLRVACTPAQHWSNRTPWDRNESLWCGYAVSSSTESFFFAGDTAYCGVFPKIAERYGPFDLAAIPIGAYEPRWCMASQHCSPDEALRIHSEVQSHRSFGIHWGTFRLALDGHTCPAKELLEARAARNGGRSNISSSSSSSSSGGGGGGADGGSSSGDGATTGLDFAVLRHGESLTAKGERKYHCVFEREHAAIAAAASGGSGAGRASVGAA